MNATEYILNFHEDAFTPDELIALIKSDLGIKKGYLKGSTHKVVEYSEKYFEQLKESWVKKDKTYVEISERSRSKNQKSGSKFTVVSPGHIKPPLNVIWRFEHHAVPPETLLYKLISNPKFVFGYAVDIEDQYRQNETSPGNYKVFGLQPTNVVYKGTHQHREIDISNNPGRRTLVINTWLTVTWKMWFGKDIQQYIPKETIKSFDKALSIKELDNCVIEVQLYERPKDASKESCREIQKVFREWIQLDNVIETLKKEEQKLREEFNKKRDPRDVINIVIPPKKKPRQPLFKSILQGLGLVEIEEDKPIPFGYKITWMAVKAGNIQAVASQFTGKKFIKTNWEMGRKKCRLGKIFISPPVSGWYLIVSPTFPTCDSSGGVAETHRILRRLSKELGKAVYFSSHRVVDHYSWVYAENGRIKRAFSTTDSEVKWDEGEKIGIETNFLYPHESKKEPGTLEMDIPNERMVTQIAGDWSVDPSQLDSIQGIRGFALVEK
jgi:hypothetical protein